MNRLKMWLLLALAWAALGLPQAGFAQSVPPNVLVLYDAPNDPQFGRLGKAYAIMLRNLVGHFKGASVELMPVEQYPAGKINAHTAVFYLGSSYDNPVPAAFLSDVANTSKTVVWFKYNLWQLAWQPSYNFTTKTGLSFTGVRGLNASPSAGDPAPGFFDTVTYKTLPMVKYYSFDAGSGAVSADPEIGQVSIADTTKATNLVPISNPKTGEQLPYVVRAGNFWYFADIPLSYIGPRDRYLVLCDLLHDIVGSTQVEDHPALVRFEDVSAISSPANMRRLTNYLLVRRIPFSVAAIPFYRDPLGRYNGGVPQEIHLAQATNLKTILNDSILRGGKIVMHGYSHQYASMPNPHTAVSGDDFEFWNIVDNRPVNEDSEAWAAARLTAGLAEFTQNGYTPFAWEAPHYQSSPASIKAAASKFKTTYQRVVYYTSDAPALAPASGPRDFAVGQFFPYVIHSDYYGQRVLPENLGNIEYNISAIDPSSSITYTWQDLLTNARYAKSVRDGYASFFFHPFWLDAALNLPGFNDFTSLVTGISALGYRWVDASTIP